MRSFFWQTSLGKNCLANGAQIWQIFNRFKPTIWRIGEIEWQIFCQTLCTNNFLLGEISLVTLTQGFNFANALPNAFTDSDPKSTKGLTA